MPSALYNLAWIREKLATVPSELKQFRRALIAHQGGHDYHGGSIGGILSSGAIHEGRGSAFGKGVYFSRKAPEEAYWQDNLFRGAIVPTENVDKQYGRIVKKEGPHSPAYSRVLSAYRLRPRDMAVVGPFDDKTVVREAQKKLRVRPISSLAYFASRLAQEGAPVQSVLNEIRNPNTRKRLQAYLSGS